MNVMDDQGLDERNFRQITCLPVLGNKTFSEVLASRQ